MEIELTKEEKIDMLSIVIKPVTEYAARAGTEYANGKTEDNIDHLLRILYLTAVDLISK